MNSILLLLFTPNEPNSVAFVHKKYATKPKSACFAADKNSFSSTEVTVEHMTSKDVRRSQKSQLTSYNFACHTKDIPHCNVEVPLPVSELTQEGAVEAECQKGKEDEEHSKEENGVTTPKDPVLSHPMPLSVCCHHFMVAAMESVFLNAQTQKLEQSFCEFFFCSKQT